MATMSPDSAVDDAILDVEQQLSVLFNRSRAVWKEAAEQVHPELQPAGYKLFGTIVRLGETNAHALADLFEMDKSAVSRQVRVQHCVFNLNVDAGCIYRPAVPAYPRDALDQPADAEWRLTRSMTVVVECSENMSYAVQVPIDCASRP